MNTSTRTRRPRTVARIAAISAAVAAGLTVSACGEQPTTEPQPATSSSRAASARQYYYDVTHPGPVQDALIEAARERWRLLDTVSKMPAGWPATEAMRRAVEAPSAPAS